MRIRIPSTSTATVELIDNVGVRTFRGADLEGETLELGVFECEATRDTETVDVPARVDDIDVSSSEGLLEVRLREVE